MFAACVRISESATKFQDSPIFEGSQSPQRPVRSESAQTTAIIAALALLAALPTSVSAKVLSSRAWKILKCAASTFLHNRSTKTRPPSEWPVPGLRSLEELACWPGPNVLAGGDSLVEVRARPQRSIAFALLGLKTTL